MDTHPDGPALILAGARYGILPKLLQSSFNMERHDSIDQRTNLWHFPQTEHRLWKTQKPRFSIHLILFAKFF